jgi:hypothetical protein
MPECEVAVAHDDDWCAILEMVEHSFYFFLKQEMLIDDMQNDTVIPDPVEILRRISEKFQVVGCGRLWFFLQLTYHLTHTLGGAYLVQKGEDTLTGSYRRRSEGEDPGVGSAIAKTTASSSRSSQQCSSSGFPISVVQDPVPKTFQRIRSSLIHTRSPPSRICVTPPRGFASSSTSHLPPSLITPTSRRASVEFQRRPSDSGSREKSPSSPILWGTSPISYSKGRHFNASTVSLSLPSTPEERELIRNATSLLCKELLRSPNPAQRAAFKRDYREVEPRMKLLMKHENFWGKSGGSSVAHPSANAEEKERKLFGDALKDGVVLCLCVFEECRVVTITDSLIADL